MTDRFIALSPLGAACFVIGGMLLGSAVHSRDLVECFFAALCFWIVREDTREAFVNGTYDRNFLFWRRRPS